MLRNAIFNMPGDKMSQTLVITDRCEDWIFMWKISLGMTEFSAF